ncbi:MULTISPECIES: cell wall metabolism sensor histidine kinase WalK [unclassified Psychrobacillus]|uniref:cell wall metabolism sensor histidine kinase WalK n=1 Tax=unclassified Psychrobacillus TaxID=2636677 RepID=UPI0011A19905|nr:cell wall metabolism sensor histidine kinase WalK [Psychrobacillus sp. AK 1817]QEY21412.1 cell wall metabolism sensor histidine kinase WalK [Psychrobacillus sp. AK 1817]QGM31925.1 cell wall metabolism sensor histidine kinase WalK [Bacillus sp. N3536]
MHKVGYFKSVHVKVVMIYVLLIIIAMQIIGLYFVKELEERLKENFEESVKDRVGILEFSAREEIIKIRAEEDQTLEQSLRSILSGLNSDDLKEVRIIDAKYQIRATSDSNNQSIVGQKSMDELVHKSISAEDTFDSIVLDSNKRIWILVTPIIHNGSVVGTVYIESNIENVFSQMNEINQILAVGTAVALVITIVLGILIAQTITRPISEMRKQAQAMSKGNFSRKVRVYGNDEIGQLAHAFNHLTNRLQEAQSTTEAERRKLASVLTNMTDGVIATDRKGRVILINDPAVRLLRIPREMVLNRPIISVLGIDSVHSFEDLIHSKESMNLDFSTQDRPFILRANFSVIQKETGFVNGLIAVLHDNTEQEKIDMERREFVANVSHELRTPLTTMSSYLEALADGAWKDDEIAPSFLKVTQTETQRMIRLVNDLLQLSKMDSRDYDLNKEIVNFNKFFNRIIDRFELSKSQNVTFQRMLPEVPYYVDIDTDKLTQVIDNIISNALKYSPDGGNIRFGIIVKNDLLQVMVSDDGMGIPSENVNRIFDRFYRVDRARARSMGGTGLGLAIAREMIEAHGGKIWAESEEGHGTTIFFTLEILLDEEGEWD